MGKVNTKRGFIGLVIVFVAALLALAYFGVDLQKITNSDLFQKNWVYIKDGGIWLWQTYLKTWVLFVYDQFLKPLLK